MEPRGATTPITAGELDSLVEAAAREGGDLQQLRAAAKRVEAAAVVADERRRSAEAGLGAGGAREGDYAELDAALDRALSDFGSDDEELAFGESCDVSVDIGAGVRRRKRLHSTASSATEEVLGRDSNAVPSVFYPEQRRLGALLSTADGGASVLCRGLQALCAVIGA